jgi:hypothetical protein
VTIAADLEGNKAQPSNSVRFVCNGALRFHAASAFDLKSLLLEAIVCGTFFLLPSRS